MPCLKIVTNLQKNKIPKDFVKNIIPVLSKAVDKPINSFVISITTDCIQSIDGDDTAPSIFGSLESIGHLGPKENKIIAKDVTDYIEKNLGISRPRIHLTFHDLAAYNIAKNGETIG